MFPFSLDKSLPPSLFTIILPSLPLLLTSSLTYFLSSGRGGLTIRTIAEESGAKISMTSKDEAIFTQERILSISGSKVSCSKCLALVIAKLAEDAELSQFVNKGTTFSASQGFDSRSSPGSRRGSNRGLKGGNTGSRGGVGGKQCRGCIIYYFLFF